MKIDPKLAGHLSRLPILASGASIFDAIDGPMLRGARCWDSRLVRTEEKLGNRQSGKIS